MLREECRVGMRVTFGSKTGQRTLGEVVKLNDKTAKVKTLESRGVRDAAGGQVWGVPYGMMQPAGETVKPEPAPGEDALMDEILNVYTGLSPENLWCDGEASAAHVRRTRASLNQRLKTLEAALGRTVSEGEAYEWFRRKQGLAV